MCALSPALPFEMEYFALYSVKDLVNRMSFILVKAQMLPDLAHMYRNKILPRAEWFTEGLSFFSFQQLFRNCLSVTFNPTSRNRSLT